jgi:hypothetical protein
MCLGRKFGSGDDASLEQKSANKSLGDSGVRWVGYLHHNMGFTVQAFAL